mmetsp:Transcript_15355/g.17272  ORF Transcript_15355/g.17272 Transcript_15355/m.17272 type:complete len:245 (-) Transcript_15355:259-993(-)
MLLQRTWTLSFGLTTSDTEFTRSAFNAEICTRPSNSPSHSAFSLLASTFTNAPKSVVLTTIPSTMTAVSHFFSIRAPKTALSSLRPPCLRPPPPRDFLAASLAAAASSSVIRLKPICPFSESILTIRTSTFCPALMTSLTSLTNSIESWETCNKPSVAAPISTNAPYEAKDLTVPVTVLPSSNSLRLFFFIGSRAAGSTLGVSSLLSTPSTSTTSVVTSSPAASANSIVLRLLMRQPGQLHPVE